MADAAQEQIKTPALTDWLESYDEQPSEVIDGEVVPMHPPGFLHSFIAHTLYDSLADFVRGRRLGRVFMETATVVDASEEENWVKGSFVPDVFFINGERLTEFIESFEGSGPFRLAPDLAVEIVSKNDSYVILNRKVELYLDYGVRLVWVIDPIRRRVRVHSPGQPLGIELDDSATLDGGDVLPGWSMPVREIMDVPGMSSEAAESGQ